MKSGSRFLRVCDGVIDRVLCVCGAVLFSQGPEYMQQYLQRLGGHLAEAQRQLGFFREAATQSGATLEQFITQTRANPDAGLSRLGSVMNDAAERTASLQAAHDALLHASLWTRPFVFFRHLDLGIAQGTWAVFKPAVPTTLEGLVYALTGMLVFVLLYHGGLKLLVGIVRRKPAPAAKPA
ncbi:MAG: DUF2937 family protein [Oleiharenicola lentus]